MLPDESGQFLWADYTLVLAALLPPPRAGDRLEPLVFGLLTRYNYSFRVLLNSHSYSETPCYVLCPYSS
jgi:hypothetical protein